MKVKITKKDVLGYTLALCGFAVVSVLIIAWCSLFRNQPGTEFLALLNNYLNPFA